MTELENYIQTYFGVEKIDSAKIVSLFKPVQLKKGDYFLQTGNHCTQLGFLQSGLMREFLYVEDKEITKWIYTKGYFVVDLASFIFYKPGRWNIQALSDCELYVLDHEAYGDIHSHVPQWPTLEKLFIAKCFTVLEERIVEHLALSAEERYRRLFEFNKELFNQIPLQYLASMMGITPETLSRIRKKGN